MGALFKIIRAVSGYLYLKHLKESLFFNKFLPNEMLNVFFHHAKSVKIICSSFNILILLDIFAHVGSMAFSFKLHPEIYVDLRHFWEDFGTLSFKLPHARREIVLGATNRLDSVIKQRLHTNNQSFFIIEAFDFCALYLYSYIIILQTRIGDKLSFGTALLLVKL